MLEFEKYLSDFNSTIQLSDFLLNLLIVTVIAYLVKLFYVRFGSAISNRAQFSNIFIPLALGTLLIITVIKSSIALSLGLVGALSIVRFRAAIKDPEELTYLFLIIGLGLMGGANKPILAIVSFLTILPILYINNKFAKRNQIVRKKSFLHIEIGHDDIETLSKKLMDHSSYLELKRVDYLDKAMNVSYYCSLDGPDQIDRIQKAILSLDESAKISFVDQPDLLA